MAELKAKLETLTPRKLEVMGLITAGLMNKWPTRERDHSQGSQRPRHRKMGARSLVQIVRMAEIVGISHQKT